MLTLRSVRRDQPLAHPDAHVAAQARIPVALHFAGVALDVDRRVLGVVLRKLVEPRVLRRRIAAQRVGGECGRRMSDQKADYAQNEQPLAFGHVSGGWGHRPDYNYSFRADLTFRGTLARRTPRRPAALQAAHLVA
jgi:hypothetical protein